MIFGPGDFIELFEQIDKEAAKKPAQNSPKKEASKEVPNSDKSNKKPNEST